MHIIRDRLNLQNLALLCDDDHRVETLTEINNIVIKEMAKQVLEYWDLRRELQDWATASDSWRSPPQIDNILHKYKIL
jgi:hypothetical protein